MKLLLRFFCALGPFAYLALPLSGETKVDAQRPNIILILADDMGFSDIGCYGSEIPTPHLDALASQGLRFARFYNTARCSPTRAALLTGLHPHQAGMGTLAEDPGKRAPATAAAGYREVLSHDSVTIAEVLRPAGYHTYMAGKWHLGYHGQEKWPLARGFERFYGTIAGASSYFQPNEPRGLTLDNTPIPVPAGDYYTTDAFTDHALQFVREQKDSAPFFLYLAFTAPHWPLQARAEDIQKFVGRYRVGWDELRKARLASQVALGITPASTTLAPRDEGARAWESLTDQQKTELDYRMAVYAAQVHRMDWNIGRLVESLRAAGKSENTLILFLSDNGGCAEPYDDLGGGTFDSVNVSDRVMIGSNTSKAGASYGTGWANASNTPFRKYKTRLHEGGIATPLIAHWPRGLKIKGGTISPAPGYLTDVMPTIIEVTGASYPREFNGKKIQPLEGASLAPVFRTGTRPQPEWFFWEQYNNKAVRRGHWKAVQPAEKDAPWELYDLSIDPTELSDRAASEPATLKALITAWQLWAESHKVLPKKSAASAP